MKIKRFQPDDASRWDAFIEEAKNGHFMFMRPYMEYHADRFEDHSLLFEDKGKLIAVLPANIVDGDLYSHGGLTFGGIVSGRKMNTAKMLVLFSSLNDYCRSEEIRSIYYKAIPHIYSTEPANEDLYALFVNGGRLYRRDVSAFISSGKGVEYSSRQRRNIRKALKHELVYCEESDYSGFWHLLADVLAGRHEARPTHSIDEIVTLAERFPNSIRLFQVKDSSQRLLAGAVLFITNTVAHTQYLASSDQGRTIGALDFLIDGLIHEFGNDRNFDFGISTVDQGRVLNEGLCSYKEGFGARALMHDFYKLDFQ